MGLLLLVRHGQASMGTAHYDRLSELGHRQAAIAGARLAAQHVDRVVRGTLERQRDSAAGLDWTGEIEVDERLDEYDQDTVLHAAPMTLADARGPDATRQVQVVLDEALARWAAGDPVPGETHSDFLARCIAARDALVAQPGVTVAVTSAGVIAVMCAELLGMAPERWPQLAKTMVNSSVTKLISGRTGTNLLSYNDFAHLDSDRALVTYR